jgi:subtilase family serine protease
MRQDQVARADLRAKSLRQQVFRATLDRGRRRLRATPPSSMRHNAVPFTGRARPFGLRHSCEAASQRKISLTARAQPHGAFDALAVARVPSGFTKRMRRGRATESFRLRERRSAAAATGRASDKKQPTRGDVMKSWTIRTFASVAASAAMLLATTGYAGTQRYGSVVGDQVSPDASADPAAAARFKCELRPFDRSNGLYCYGPAAIRAAYGVNGLLNAGFDGTGHTIVILDAFGSPFVADDLKLFDAVFGLPNPNFKQIYMPGTPPYNPSDGNIVGWTGEIALDVEWSHAIAPGANIVLVAAKSNFDQDLIDAFNYAVDNNLGDVISMSFGEGESYLANPDGLDIVNAWNKAFAKARKRHITLLVSSGDGGSDTSGIGSQTAGWPAASALVTSVGGTNLKFGTATNANPNGAYQSERSWNDGYGAGGGGMSILTPEPNYQKYNLSNSVNKTLHGYRGVPDVAYNAGVVGGVVVAWAAPLGPGAFFIFGGTSAGAPQWAGLVADINQARGGRVGFINRKLYNLGGGGQLWNLFHDITLGDNGVYASDGSVLVPGFPATPGYDLSTGWGTPSFGMLGALLSGDDDDGSSDP